jgi:hypothetical protein
MNYLLFAAKDPPFKDFDEFGVMCALVLTLLWLVLSPIAWSVAFYICARNDKNILVCFVLSICAAAMWPYIVIGWVFDKLIEECSK